MKIFILLIVLLTHLMTSCNRVPSFEKKLDAYQFDFAVNPLHKKLFELMEDEIDEEPLRWKDFKSVVSLYHLDGEYSIAFSTACAYKLLSDPLFFLRAYSSGNIEALEYAHRGYSLLDNREKNI